MTAVIGMVAFILVMIGISTSAILSQVLLVNLDASVTETASEIQPRVSFQASAADVLESGRNPDGTLLVVNTRSGGPSGAVVAGDSVRALTTDDLSQIADALSSSGQTLTVDLPNLGEYFVKPYSAPGGSGAFLVGLPLSNVTGYIGAILTTVALVTAGGLLLLAVVIAIVIRLGLKPLRAVAETATRVASLRMDQGDVSITERVPAEQVDEHTEIGQVGAALNTLLDRVDASLTARQRNEELMRRFVADASHELRTPLASIRGFSELSLRAMRQAQDDESRQRTAMAVETTEQSLERIQAQSVRMTTLVEDLLLLARLDEGQELVYGSVDLARLAVEAVGDARPAGPDHSWTIDVPDEPVELAGDASRLHQVIANLLANARTHTPAGSVVAVSVTREGQEAVLRVHDDGPGIDPSVASQLFERFARADRSRDRKTGGTGLGLSIARAIVDAHNGTIAVHSIPGDTTFEVRLPAKPADPV
ncbi:sensor histidine kinase [Microbacterium trichothecenolyticum]|uniref:histidine kinase n=1 Tax=Microbacterium trichothecenolyticum TaxID=69370 RepID=A0ABU0TPR3_MICTR|nr:HAMP domain-containing sensor histidine kinase [Microbacterium trichothecenolyticum]MDQ1121660.1 two-component system OmpR family sensor kinase [Microbacterium trichothecenolyticum]